MAKILFRIVLRVKKIRGFKSHGGSPFRSDRGWSRKCTVRRSGSSQIPSPAAPGAPARPWGRRAPEVVLGPEGGRPLLMRLPCSIQGLLRLAIATQSCARRKARDGTAKTFGRSQTDVSLRFRGAVGANTRRRGRPPHTSVRIVRVYECPSGTRPRTTLAFRLSASPGRSRPGHRCRDARWYRSHHETRWSARESKPSRAQCLAALRSAQREDRWLPVTGRVTSAF